MSLRILDNRGQPHRSRSAHWSSTSSAVLQLDSLQQSSSAPLSQHREMLRLLLVVGVLGGFTTFSSFAFDSIELVDDGRSGQAMLYIILTNVLGIGAALLFARLIKV